jgi:ABC-type phosphate transport system permease subunit
MIVYLVGGIAIGIMITPVVNQMIKDYTNRK